MTLTGRAKQLKRAPSHPLPTVTQIEDAIDTLLNTFLNHENQRKRNWPKGKRYWPKNVLPINTETEYLPHEEYIADPIGYSHLFYHSIILLSFFYSHSSLPQLLFQASPYKPIDQVPVIRFHQILLHF